MASVTLNPSVAPLILENRDGSPSSPSTSGDENESSIHYDSSAFCEKRSLGDIPCSERAKKRRKQSNPIRLATPLVLEDVGPGMTDVVGRALNQNDDRELDRGTVEPGEEALVTEIDDDNNLRLREVHTHTKQCPYCTQRFYSDEDLKSHLEHEHVQKILQSQLHQKPPAAYGRDTPLNLTCQRDSDFMDNKSTKLQGTNPSTPVSQNTYQIPAYSDANKVPFSGFLPLSNPFLLPFLSPSGTSPGTHHSSSIGNGNPLRIFNPEAFCDLCKKEFCNKYFLKTHKANKHGIYTETCTPGSVSSGSPFTGSFLTSNVGGSPLRPVLRMPPFLASSKSATLYTAVKPDSVSNEQQNVNNTNMRVPCEQCQKKFCNKYFLRRHKAKVHGIFYDNIASLQQQGNECSPDNQNNFADVPAKIEEHENKNEIQHFNEADSNTLSAQIKTEFSMNGYPVTSPTPEKQMKEGESSNEATPILTGNISPYGTGPIINKTSELTKVTSVSTDKLRQMGVINADAFCEICCKEYCNKYFLKTHKMKRHGIMYADMFEIKSPSSSQPPVGQNLQRSPLNLIVSEHGNSSSDSLEKLPFQTPVAANEEPECEVCGRRFQSTYFLQMHRSYFHTNQPKSGEQEDSNRSSPIEETTTKHADACGYSSGEGSSEDLQKLQTMILQLNEPPDKTTCPICTKVLSNQYGLQDHMMNDHGLLSGDEQKEEEAHTPRLATPKENNCVSEVKEQSSSTIETTQPSPELKKIVKEAEGRDMPDKTLAVEKRVAVMPSSSFCEICNKELCNKYFMKTHMQRMHGIEIENGAQIGGVVCDICHKELCSKYFLRVHRQNAHGIVEDNSPTLVPKEGSNSSLPVSEGDSSLKPTESGDTSNRYFTHFTEVCCFCNRRFRSAKWLKSHLLSDHGEAGKEKWKALESQQYQQEIILLPRPLAKHDNKISPSVHSLPYQISNNQAGLSNHAPKLENGSFTKPRTDIPAENSRSFSPGEYAAENQNAFLSGIFSFGNDYAIKNYQCTYCSFSTPVLALLFIHERSHVSGLSAPTKTLQCPTCFQCFTQAEAYQHHLLTHQFSGMLSSLLPPHALTRLPLQTEDAAKQYIAPCPPHTEETLEMSTPSKKLKDDHPNKTTAPVLEDNSTRKMRFKCSKCDQVFKVKEDCVRHIQVAHAKRSNGPTMPIRCRRCSFSCLSSTALKNHTKREHRATAENLKRKSICKEIQRELVLAAQRSHVPAVYAVPPKSTSDKNFVMQAFFLEQKDPGHVIPALVYLPVTERLKQRVTVSLTLTPA